MTEDPTQDDGIRRRTVLKSAAVVGLSAGALSAPGTGTSTFSRTKTQAYTTSGDTIRFDFTDLPTDPSSDVDLAIDFGGDYKDDHGSEWADIYVEGEYKRRTNGYPTQCDRFYTENLTGLSRSLVTDGELDVRIENGSGVGTCSPGEVRVTVSYQVNESPVADAGGSYAVDEGGAVELDGTNSYDPDGSLVAHRWDLDGDGSFEVDDPTPVFDASGIDGPTTRTVTLEVEDDDGSTDTASADVTVNNVPPSVGADAGSVTVDEGQTATNTGTYSDPVDGVTLSASPGSVSKTGGGNWEWTYDTTDEDDSTTVSVTADDGDATTTTTFDLDVDNVAPSLTVDTDPVRVEEGDTATNTGTYSDPADPVDLSASPGTVAKTGGGNWEWTYDTADDDDSTTVTVTASDDETSTTADFQLAVGNVDPTVSIDSISGSLEEAGEATIDVTYSDPGTTDTHTARVEWGDGAVTDLATGDIDQGADSFSASHTYAQDGTYDVTVTVYDDEGNGADTRTLEISNVAPTLTVDTDPVSVPEGATATNTGTYSDPADPVDLSASRGTVTEDPDGAGTWAWEFPTGDDDDTGPVTVHATDDHTTTSREFQLAVGNVDPSVTIDSVSGSLDEGAEATVDVNYSDPSSTDTHTARVEWGDGAATDLASGDVNQADDAFSVSHTYAQDGTYEVAVTVYDDEGSGADTRTLAISNVAPEVDVVDHTAAATSGNPVDLRAEFTDAGVEDTHTAEVDWGAGEPTESVAVDQGAGEGSLEASHTYTENGDYTVTVRVSDGDGATGEATAEVHVNAPPDPAIATDQATPVPVTGDPITFDGTGSVDPDGPEAEMTYEWDFGDDGSTDATGPTVRWTYADPGDKTVTLTVTDAFGASRSVTRTVAVGFEVDLEITPSRPVDIVQCNGDAGAAGGAASPSMGAGRAPGRAPTDPGSGDGGPSGDAGGAGPGDGPSPGRSGPGPGSAPSGGGIDRCDVPVRVVGDAAFDPMTDLDVGSLRFGAPELVARGGGARPVDEGRRHSTSSFTGSRPDVLVYFPADETAITNRHDRATLVGRTDDDLPVLGTRRLNR